MLAKALSCAVVGLDSALVEVEVDLAQGLPALTIVGLPDAAVQEAKERVRAAVRNSGLSFPMKRITVNLAPADLRKEGPSYDLPMAVALLAASEQVALDPAQTPLPGRAWASTARCATPPASCPWSPWRASAASPPSTSRPSTPSKPRSSARSTVIPVRTLAELVAHLRGEAAIAPAPSAEELLDSDDAHLPDRLRRRARPGARQARPGGGRGRGA